MVLTAEGLIHSHSAKYMPDSAGVQVYRAPGRVNLIGEHTDYTEGLVLPIALHLACYVTRSRNASGEIRAFAADSGEERRWPIASLPYAKPADDWGDYVVGVARELLALGYPVEPCNLRIQSTVPIGAGLSSSAAVEVSVALALLDGKPIDSLELIRLCRRAENLFVGTPCGVMDQYISVKGEEGAALQIDCRTLKCRPVRLPSEIAIIAVNSMVKHDLGESAYGTRVKECNTAREQLGVPALRDAKEEDLGKLSGDILKRARHVVTENARVRAFVKASESGQIQHLGELCYASHSSLRDDFEVSCIELDALVEIARSIDGVYGARMTGGGFGGCTVNLLKPDLIGQFETMVREQYLTRFQVEPKFYRCIPSAGASRLG